MCIEHCDNISTTGRYFFHSSLRKFSSSKTEHRHVTALPGPSRQHTNVSHHTLILKATHICCAHLRPHGSTLHVAAHLGPHGSTLDMSWHACNPTAAQACRRERWAWNLSKAQIRPDTPVKEYCSRPTELGNLRMHSSFSQNRTRTT